jgi:hypothetical protein
MFNESRYRLLREEKVSKCSCCYPSNERPNERMIEWMDQLTRLSPAANYPYYSCCLLPKNKRLIKKIQLRTLDCSTCLPQHCLLPWQTSLALHFQCMPTVQSHSGNIVECGAVSPGKWFRVKQWKKSCRTETEPIRFFKTSGSSYHHMIRRYIPHDFTVQMQAAFSVRNYFNAT